VKRGPKREGEERMTFKEKTLMSLKGILDSCIGGNGKKFLHFMVK